jgi:hypothetical protein
LSRHFTCMFNSKKFILCWIYSNYFLFCSVFNVKINEKFLIIFWKTFHFCFTEHYSSSSWKNCHMFSATQKMHNVFFKFRWLGWAENISIRNIVHSNDALMKWKICS